MARHFKKSFFMLFLLMMYGCVHVDVPILQPMDELRERTLEGEGKAKLLITDIEGFISEKGRSGVLKERPSLVAEVRESLKKAEKDPDLAGVVLRINSPGGTVAGSDIIHHELLKFRERTKVPVFACITGIGTSGAYYIATAADEVSAHPAAITGSIGVMVMRFNVEGLLTKIGVSEKTVKSTDKKDFLSPFRPATPEEEKILQEIINSLNSRFIDVITARSGGKLSRAEVERVADGRIYTAEQAVKARLIDRIGYLDDAVAALKTRLNLKEARVVTYFRPGGYRGTIYSASPAEAPRVMNLISINADGLDLLTGTEFMYLWRP